MNRIKHILTLALLALTATASASINADMLEITPDNNNLNTLPEIEDKVAEDNFKPMTFDTLESVKLDTLLMNISSKALKKNKKKDFNFVPDPKRALWLALVCPGAGQIYNRKYWKLPIIYGGFLGCTYALLWNQQMYHDYSQAYLDIMDDDPNTASYKNMLPMGYDITGREEQFKKVFEHKRDYYRKYRDMSIFAFFGVYLLSVVDAYVDAQLSTFDISKDLSISVEPTSIKQEHVIGNSNGRTLGVQCSLNF